MRNATINIRVQPEQRDAIDMAARLLGKSRSDFMLEVACERAQSVLLDQVVFKLNEEQMQRFNALIDAPPRPNAGLQRLMAVEAPWSPT